MARWGLAVPLLASCTLSSPAVTPGDSGPPADGPALADSAPEPPVLPTFAPPVPIDELNAAGAGDDDATLTADRLVVLFNSNRGGNEDIWTSTRPDVDSPWAAPEPVIELNSPERESTTAISPDGLAVLLASDRAGDFDVLLSTRPTRTSQWSPPAPLAELNSAAGDFASYLSADRLTVILHSDRGGDFDLYIARRASEVEPFDSPMRIPGVNSTGDDNSGRFAAGERVLTFHSDRDGNPDLHAATRAGPGEPFGPVEPITELNTPEIEQDFWLADDLCVAMYASHDAQGESSIVETRCQ